jgi:hypothetical protein
VHVGQDAYDIGAREANYDGDNDPEPKLAVHLALLEFPIREHRRRQPGKEALIVAVAGKKIDVAHRRPNAARLLDQFTIPASSAAERRRRLRRIENGLGESALIFSRKADNCSFGVVCICYC